MPDPFGLVLLVAVLVAILAVWRGWGHGGPR